MSLPQSEIDARVDYARGLSGYETQRRWYSTRASQLKKRAQIIDLVIIGIGALIAAVPSLISETYVARVVSVLGIAIAVLQGGQRIYRSGETWPEYRQASEDMKREMRLFANGSGIYDTDTDSAKAHYKDRLEAIIGGEQSGYFDRVAKQPQAGAGPSKPKS